MISVFRIYLGRSWIDSQRATDLLGLLDAVPEFLHRVSMLPTDVAHGTELSEAQRVASARVAMTQSHVVMLWGGRVGPASEAWTASELQVAGSGLRRRIPVLVVEPPGGELAPMLRAAGVDLMVGWAADEIACSVQQLAEQAAAARRSAAQSPPGQELAELGQAAAPTPPANRPLPTLEIADAWAQLRAARDAVGRDTSV